MTSPASGVDTTLTDTVAGGSADGLMPAAFFGHGNPMNALEVNRYTAAWRAFGAGGAPPARDPRDQRALVHQRHRGDRDAAAAHDPRLLRLPARRCSTSSTRRRGCPSWPTRSATWSTRPGSAPTSTAGASTTAPGRCWCTPSPTPRSRSCSCRINAEQALRLPPRARRASWRRCASAGVLIIGSGNVVHNLRGMDWKLTDDGYDWAQRFDEDAKERMLTDPTEFATLDAHPDYGARRPHPGPLHPGPLPRRPRRRRRRRPRPTCSSTATPTGRCR